MELIINGVAKSTKKNEKMRKKVAEFILKKYILI